MRISSKISWYLLTDAILMQDHRKNDQEDQTRLQTMKNLSLSYEQQYSLLKCSTYMNNEHSWNTTPTSAIVIISRTTKGTRHYVDRPAVNLVELKSTAVTMLGSIVRHCTEYSQNSQRGNSLNIFEMFAIQKKSKNSTGRLLKGAKKSAKEFKVIIRILTRLPSTQRTARPSVPVWFKCE